MNMMPLLIEMMVGLLLALTIGFCWKLNGRLRALSSDHGVLKSTIADLTAATANAHQAIAGLRQAVRDCDELLGSRLERAEQSSLEIAGLLREGEVLVARVTAIAQATRRGAAMAPPAGAEVPPAPVSRASETLAAAQAFALRARERAA